MTEGTIRKVHATVGAILSIFLLVQIGSGTILTFNELLGHGHHVHTEDAGQDDVDHKNNTEKPTDSESQIIHHHGGRLVQALRSILGVGALFIVLSGLRIYALTRRRKRGAISGDIIPSSLNNKP